MKAFGTLIKIDDYKRLVVEITEPTYKFAQSQSLHCWTYQDKYYMRIGLDKYDKKLMQKKFEPLLKKPVVILADVKKYEFEVEGVMKKGVYCLLTTILHAPKQQEKQETELEPAGLTPAELALQSTE